MGGCIAIESGVRCDAPRELGAVFCRAHLTAPAGRRGGWISAERRRRARSAAHAPHEAPMNMSNITPRLWVGAQPPFDRDLPDFDVLVLCARELQPGVIGFRRAVVRVPLPDATLSTDEIRTAIIGGRAVAKALTAGSRVLVTCAMGLNRSALVASLGLGMVTRMTGPQIVALVRARRTPDAPPGDGALSNPHFVQIIEQFVGSRGIAGVSSQHQAARRRAR